MKKCVLQTCLSSSWGGLEMVALEKATRLRDAGIEVVTAVLPASPLAQRLQQAGLEILPLSPGSKYFAPGTVFKLRRLLRERAVESVLVQHLRDLWYVVPALIGHRQVQLIGIAHMFLAVNKRDLLHRWIYGRLNHLVALTSIHKQNLMTYLPIRAEQITILPNAVDAQRFSPQKKATEVRRELCDGSADVPLIGVVTRLDPQKGLLEVVRAAALLREQGLAFRLTIVGEETRGEESFKSVLQDEIARLQIDDHVRLAGHRADIEAVMASLDVLLMSAPAETFGRVLIEAMASQVAVVACSGGGVRDVVDDGRNGLLVPPADPIAMAKALRRVLEDVGLRQQLAVNGLEKARTTYDAVRIERELDRLLLR